MAPEQGQVAAKKCGFSHTAKRFPLEFIYTQRAKQSRIQRRQLLWLISLDMFVHRALDSWLFGGPAIMKYTLAFGGGFWERSQARW